METCDNCPSPMSCRDANYCREMGTSYTSPMTPTEQMAQQIAKKREAELEQLERLRALRLDHWRKCLAARERAKASEVRADALEDLTDVYTKGYCVKLRNSAAEQHAVADDHLAAVITLNYYFDQGDTAEKDAAK